MSRAGFLRIVSSSEWIMRPVSAPLGSSVGVLTGGCCVVCASDE